MAEYINRRRNIFINSEQYHQSNGDVNLILPGADFAVDKNEIMRLSLESFTMQRRFYNINENNNTFYIRDISDATDHTFSKVVISPGDYEETTTFALKVKEAINIGLGLAYDSSDAVVTIQDETRLITINMSAETTWTDKKDFVCFQVPQGRAGTNPINTVITPTGSFNDSCETLGGVPTKDFNHIVPAFIEDPSYTFTSIYPFSLYSLDAIHLVTNLQTHSYQTPDFLENSETSSLVPSSIFAKIPIFSPNPQYTLPNPQINPVYRFGFWCL
jgi:hypothetical protein